MNWDWLKNWWEKHVTGPDRGDSPGFPRTQSTASGELDIPITEGTPIPSATATPIAGQVLHTPIPGAWRPNDIAALSERLSYNLTANHNPYDIRTLPLDKGDFAALVPMEDWAELRAALEYKRNELGELSLHSKPSPADRMVVERSEKLIPLLKELLEISKDAGPESSRAEVLSSIHHRQRHEQGVVLAALGKITADEILQLEREKKLPSFDDITPNSVDRAGGPPAKKGPQQE